MSTPILQTMAISKSFGHVRALEDVTLDLRAGETLTVLGDNGAGKSTLIKILSGLHNPDTGVIKVDGAVTSFGKPADAARAGIATVYQDLALVDTRDVASNLFLGCEPTRGPFVDRRRLYHEAEQLLDGLTVALPSVRVPVGMLSGGQRQAVAVGRVLVKGARVVIMDEPTAALGVQESAKVMSLIDRLRDQGKAIVIVSHNLQQIWDHSDRFLVLHLGKVAGIRKRQDTSIDDIVRLIVYGAPRPDEETASNSDHARLK